jgi:hypothetical protein
VTNEEYNDELLHIIRENMKTVDSINSQVHSLEAMWKTKKVEKIDAFLEYLLFIQHKLEMLIKFLFY